MLSHIELIGSNGKIISQTRRGERKDNIPPKVVRQYKLDGVFLEKFNSAREAAEAQNIPIKDIHAAASGKMSSAGEYKWQYEKR